MPGGYVVRDATGQTLAFVYSRDSDSEARQAKVLTKDEAPDRRQRRAAAGAAGEGGAGLIAGLVGAGAFRAIKTTSVGRPSRSPRLILSRMNSQAAENDELT
jgi:hypothetical protein